MPILVRRAKVPSKPSINERDPQPHEELLPILGKGRAQGHERTHHAQRGEMHRGGGQKGAQFRVFGSVMGLFP